MIAFQTNLLALNAGVFLREGVCGRRGSHRELRRILSVIGRELPPPRRPLQVTGRVGFQSVRDESQVEAQHAKLRAALDEISYHLGFGSIAYEAEARRWLIKEIGSAAVLDAHLNRNQILDEDHQAWSAGLICGISIFLMTTSKFIWGKRPDSNRAWVEMEAQLSGLRVREPWSDPSWPSDPTILGVVENLSEIMVRLCGAETLLNSNSPDCVTALGKTYLASVPGLFRLC